MEEYKKLILPSKRQWKSWSVPSKLTFIGFWVFGMPSFVWMIFSIYVTIYSEKAVEAVEGNSGIYNYKTLSELERNIPNFKLAKENIDIDIDKLLKKSDKELDKIENFELEVLGSNDAPFDLNYDGLTEFNVYTLDHCGATGNCAYHILSYDVKSANFFYVGELFGNSVNLTGKSINGWQELVTTYRMGACESIVTFYTYFDGWYKKTSEENKNLCEGYES